MKCICCGKEYKKEFLTQIMCNECFDIARSQKPDDYNFANVEEFQMDSKNRIVEICDATKDLLLYKNSKYGDSALHPNNVFYKGDSVNSILIRLDDKIGRVKSNPDSQPRVNDISDIIGYCTLLLISMGVTAEDIAKFKD